MRNRTAAALGFIMGVPCFLTALQAEEHPSASEKEEGRWYISMHNGSSNYCQSHDAVPLEFTNAAKELGCKSNEICRALIGYARPPQSGNIKLKVVPGSLRVRLTRVKKGADRRLVVSSSLGTEKTEAVHEFSHHDPDACYALSLEMPWDVKGFSVKWILPDGKESSMTPICCPLGKEYKTPRFNTPSKAIDLGVLKESWTESLKHAEIFSLADTVHYYKFQLENDCEFPNRIAGSVKERLGGRYCSLFGTSGPRKLNEKGNLVPPNPRSKPATSALEEIKHNMQAIKKGTYYIAVKPNLKGACDGYQLTVYIVSPCIRCHDCDSSAG